MTSIHIEHTETLKKDWNKCFQKKSHALNRPFITASVAQSLDGCISINRKTRTQLSGQESSKLTHAIRSWHDGILVGSGTFATDNPKLTVRTVEGVQPRRIVLNSKLKHVDASKMTRDHYGKPWFFCNKELGHNRINDELRYEVFKVDMEPNGLLSLPQCLDLLYKRGISHLMIEGGQRVLTSFLEQRLVDFLIITIAPVFLQNRHSVTMHGLERKITPYISPLKSFQLAHDLIAYGATSYLKEHKGQMANLQQTQGFKNVRTIDYSWERVNEQQSSSLV